MENGQKVTLKTGIPSGKTTITELTIRKPLTGDLRGVKLIDFIELDINALAKVLPRITTPTIEEHEVFQMDLLDLSEVTKVMADFLSPTSTNANKVSQSA